MFVYYISVVSVQLIAAVRNKPFIHISENNVQISPNFLYVLPTAMAHSFSDGTAISYLLLVLWMTSF